MAVGNYQQNANGARYFAQGLFEESATAKHRLGTTRELDDGRRFVYCQATAANIAAGMAISKTSLVQAMTVAAADAAINLAGVKQLTFTLTGTPTLNLYQDGILTIKYGPGLGCMYKVRGNTADDNPASERFTVNLYDAIETTHTTATTAQIITNPYKSVLINPAVANGDATTAERIMGVTTRIVTASYYFWAQTWGLANVLIDVSTAGNEADEKVLVAGATAGRLLLSAAGAENDQARYGMAMINADYTDVEAGLVFLMIS